MNNLVVLFQFLIGTLKTFHSLKQLEGFMGKFQFLIGTLKTSPSPVPLSDPNAVSIPHRYAKNLGGWKMKIIAKEVFQFLIGTLKTRICRA